jgi:hypothetical protein
LKSLIADDFYIKANRDYQVAYFSFFEHFTKKNKKSQIDFFPLYQVKVSIMVQKLDLQQVI